MATLSTLATYDFEELVIRCAEMAGVLRAARRAGAAVPVLCLLDCDPRHWTAWGRSEVCTNCGTRPLGADVWHAALVHLLRETTAAERRAA
ncbi:MAG TPA: hypothetical protein VKV26_16230 [Dehalococcoidia bacterium]|nr:hypothetical protein [Dehalococcoidia bacterium]